MLYSSLRAALFNTPLMVTQERLCAIVDAIGPRLLGIDDLRIKFDADHTAEQRRTPTFHGVDIPSGLAVIPVLGTLTNNRDGMNAQSEPVMSYARIRHQFNAARNDPTVNRILLYGDSNGGEANGNLDLSDDIYKARGAKPIDAYIDGGGYSACYGIVSAADRVILSRSAGAGSIGVLSVLLNAQKWAENKGFEYRILRSGSQKAEVNQYETPSDEAVGRIQGEVDRLAAIFHGTVARNRNLTTDAVRDTQGGVFHGAEAVDAGLADSVMSFSGYIESITKTADPSAVFSLNAQTKETPMSNETDTPKGDDKTPAAFSAKDAQAVVDACLKANVPHLASLCIQGELSGEQLQARINDAKAAKAECVKAGCPEKANEWLAAGLNCDQIKAKLWDEKSADLLDKASKSTKEGLLSVLAGQDEQTPIQGRVDANPAESQSSLEDGWRKTYKANGVKLRAV